MSKLALQEADHDPENERVVDNAKDFRKRLRYAKPGVVIIYHTSEGHRCEEVFAAARKAFDAGKVILYQRRHGEVWEYCARRCTDTASGWIDRISSLTEAPYNHRKGL